MSHLCPRSPYSGGDRTLCPVVWGGFQGGSAHCTTGGLRHGPAHRVMVLGETPPPTRGAVHKERPGEVAVVADPRRGVEADLGVGQSLVRLRATGEREPGGGLVPKPWGATKCVAGAHVLRCVGERLMVGWGPRRPVE